MRGRLFLRRSTLRQKRLGIGTLNLPFIGQVDGDERKQGIIQDLDLLNIQLG